MEQNFESLSLRSMLADAPGHPLIWTQFLETLTAQLACDSAALLASDLIDSENTRFLFSAFIPKDYQQLYENKLNQLDQFNQFICQNPRDIFSNNSVASIAADNGRKPFIPLYQQKHRLGVSIPCTNKHALSLLLNRCRVFSEAEQEHARQLLHHLLPDLEKAMHAEQHHKIRTQLRQLLDGHFDSYIIIDAELNIVLADPVFKALMQQMDCVKITENRFGMKNPVIEQRLKSLITQNQSASIHNQCQSCQIILLPIASLKNLYPWECYEDGFIVTFTHNKQENPALERLVALYQLSHCEAVCALHFMQTPSITDIASTTYRSQETVRNHLKHVMQKMDVHSQAELMKELMALASL